MSKSHCERGISQKKDGKSRRSSVDSLLGVSLERTIQIFGWNVYAKYAGHDSLALVSEWIRANVLGNLQQTET